VLHANILAEDSPSPLGVEAIGVVDRGEVAVHERHDAIPVKEPLEFEFCDLVHLGASLLVGWAGGIRMTWEQICPKWRWVTPAPAMWITPGDRSANRAAEANDVPIRINDGSLTLAIVLVVGAIDRDLGPPPILSHSVSILAVDVQ
jgi:hypothetical protein